MLSVDLAYFCPSFCSLGSANSDVIYSLANATNMESMASALSKSTGAGTAEIGSQYSETEREMAHKCLA